MIGGTKQSQQLIGIMRNQMIQLVMRAGAKPPAGDPTKPAEMMKPEDAAKIVDDILMPRYLLVYDIADPRAPRCLRCCAEPSSGAPRVSEAASNATSRNETRIHFPRTKFFVIPPDVIRRPVPAHR